MSENRREGFFWTHTVYYTIPILYNSSVADDSANQEFQHMSLN